MVLEDMPKFFLVELQLQLRARNDLSIALQWRQLTPGLVLLQPLAGSVADQYQDA